MLYTHSTCIVEMVSLSYSRNKVNFRQ